MIIDCNGGGGCQLFVATRILDRCAQSIALGSANALRFLTGAQTGRVLTLFPRIAERACPSSADDRLQHTALRTTCSQLQRNAGNELGLIRGDAQRLCRVQRPANRVQTVCSIAALIVVLAAQGNSGADSRSALLVALRSLPPLLARAQQPFPEP